MEVDLVTSGLAEQASVEVDDYNTNAEAINFEGERCGICMDIIIDRGVLDCCQHWFCFVCIDNWATITNLCPLCQNEFQLITCVPVYDTIGTSKADDDLYSRDDDWSIEGMNNTLSFPSYYIDENAVICLDGDGCKIRNGSAAIDGDSNFDTSIACDSCDLWYHAFCVGFDPEGTSEGTWLCPRCVVDDMPQKPDGNLEQPSNNPSGSGVANGDSLSEDTYSRKVSISVADSGETAIVVSMVGRNKVKEEPQDDSLSTVEVDKDLKTQTFILTSEDTSQKRRTPPKENSITQPILKAQELELSLSCDTSSSVPSSCLVKREVVISADKSMNEHINFGGIKSSFGEAFNEAHTSNDLSGSNAVMGLHLGLSVGTFLSVDEMNNNVTEDQMIEVVKQHMPSEEHASRAEKSLADAEEDAPGATGVKRKHSYCSARISANANGDDKTKIENEASSKKMRVEGRFQPILSKDKLNVSASDDSENSPLVAVPTNDQLKCLSEQENAASDIMSIVRGTTHRPSKGLKFRNAADKSSKELETVAGLRVKKIMKRAAEDKESSMVVQKLRKEIREAVRNKSVKDYGENLFDPKLLAAFRAAVAGPRTESAKTLSQLAVKAKKSMLQRGKVRENLTKKIYSHSNGRRKRAWDRDCEIEFWKHRCQQASKPEKIQTLKSVLDLLRNGSESTETVLQGSERQAADPILSRLYLADTSVFPRKDDIKPLAALKTSGDSEASIKQTTLAEKRLKSSLNNSSTVEADKGPPKVGKKSNAASLKDTAASRSPLSSLGSSKPNTHREASVKSEDVKTDKRKWALEVLARKTGGGGESVANGKQDDMAVLKGNYPLLAQLPIDMRPVLAPSCRNKIPMSVRQAQLYRITEHLLRKANLPVIRRTAETELAVADAVNIEKEVAERANSKPVYLNLCSQEISHRSENKSSRGPEIDSLSDKVSEIDSLLPSADPADISKQSKNELSTDPIIQEALKNAGLLSDSPPNSPDQRMEVQPDEGEPSINIGEDGPEDILEMDNVEDLDIYGEFEYSLDDEDYIGVSATKVSNVQPQEGASKMKLVFSTLQSKISSSASDVEKTQNLGNAEVPNNSSSTLDKHTDVGLSNSTMEGGTDNSLVPAEALFGKEGEEPSVAECEELYGPDKEPLIKNLPEGELTKLYGTSDAEACVPKQAIGNESCVEKSTSIGHHSSAGESSPNHSEMSETARQREKKSDADSIKRPDNSISKKVEAYIKEHIRPLCKSGVITAEQYRWAVAKTTEKVMKYHCKAKNANFLIKEGEKVKKLAEQYVETAKQKEKSSLPFGHGHGIVN